jgi:hypothetical protein
VASAAGANESGACTWIDNRLGGGDMGSKWCALGDEDTPAIAAEEVTPPPPKGTDDIDENEDGADECADSALSSSET